jgi:hypothetical protein
VTLNALQRRLSCLAAEPSITAYFDGQWRAHLTDAATMTVGVGSGENLVDAIAAAEFDFRQVVAARWAQERKEQGVLL